MEVQRHNLLHAVFDHLCGEKVCLPLFVHRDLSEVLQQDGADGFGRVGHVNGPVVTHHLTHVWQSTAVIQMEMTEGHTRRKLSIEEGEKLTQQLQYTSTIY